MSKFALVKKCQVCKNNLSKKDTHHYLCQKCWERKQEEMGNLCHEYIVKQRDGYVTGFKRKIQPKLPNEDK